MAKKSKSNKLWADIDINKDFYKGLEMAEDVEIDEYNRENMIIFSANVNYARQLPRLSDSLKPVQRRILYTLYLHGLKNGKKKKSVTITGAVTEIHPHGGASVYATNIGMAQYWKMAVPLIRVYGSYGTMTDSVYAADRYTEISMSDYAYSCFFRDYDEDCVQTIFNTTGNRHEPVSLPSRYPNVIINGGMGIAVGNAFRIPPFNVNDIIKATKQVLREGDTNDTPIYMVPDFPTGCDIVDIDDSIKRICETGKGAIRMRAKTEIVDEGKNWGIHVTNLPWGVSMENIHDSVVDITRKGLIPIKDTQDRHEQIVLPDGRVESAVDYWILVDKAHDPYAVREKLFKKTKLEETLAIDFNVVLDELALVRLPMRGLIKAWIEVRREYKRRLINKRISKLTADIEMLRILIEVMTGKKLEKTVSIIRHSAEADIVKNLVSEYGMSSYQAERISSIQLSRFNKDAPARYGAELIEREKELHHYMKLVRSEREIDTIIEAELDELKKWASPRKSQVINPNSGQTMDTDTEYFVLITNKGGIKKLSVEAVEKSRKGFGVFGQDEWPTHTIRGKNLETLIFIDSFGKYSILKIGDIDTMSIANGPVRGYDITKLEGRIIAAELFQHQESIEWLRKEKMGELYLISISENGFIKKMPVSELIDMTNDGIKLARNVKFHRLKDGDALTHASYYLGDRQIVIYTKRGEYAYTTTRMIPEFGVNAQGNQMIRLSPGDTCAGCCAVNERAEFIVVVTSKGLAKKCEMAYLGDPSPAKHTSYLAAIDTNDEVVYVDTPEKSIDVCTRLGSQSIQLEEIKTLGRKAKPVKKIGLGSGDNIITVFTH